MNSLLAYQGDYELFGTANDPMIGQRIGGTITFGGGLALYSGKSVVGGLGLSGDTACADHSVAWQTRINLKLSRSRLQSNGSAAVRDRYGANQRSSALPKRCWYAGLNIEPRGLISDRARIHNRSQRIPAQKTRRLNCRRGRSC